MICCDLDADLAEHLHDSLSLREHEAVFDAFLMLSSNYIQS